MMIRYLSREGKLTDSTVDYLGFFGSYNPKELFEILFCYRSRETEYPYWNCLGFRGLGLRVGNKVGV